MLKKRWKSSLVRRSLWVWLGIVLLVLVGMSASLLITRSTDGDAERINISGSLRMQSYRISQYLLRVQTGAVGESSYFAELEEFDRRLSSSVLENLLTLSAADEQHQALRYVHQRWFTLKKRLLIYRQIPIKTLLDDIDEFVDVIDNMVHLFEKSTERKIQLLERIHGVSFFLVLMIAIVALVNMYRTVVVPIRRLAGAADKVRHGDLSARVDYIEDDELGILVQAFNHMAHNMELSYLDLEKRVNSKTARLREKTASLELLYETARLLQQSGEYSEAMQRVLINLQNALGSGQLSLYLNDHALPYVNSGDWYQKIESGRPLDVCGDCIIFAIEDRQHHYGYVCWKDGLAEHQEKEHRQLVQAVVDQLAAALSQEWKNEQSHRLMLAEERATIARELHDSIAQALAYLKIQVAKWQTLNRRGASSEELGEITLKIKDGINAAYGQLRELLVTFRLRLDDPGLEAALNATAAEYRERGGLNINLDYQLGALSLRPNAEIHVLQIAREALSNVVRHANASNVLLRIMTIGDRLEMRVSDDGVGLNQDDGGLMHHGLSIMSERAQSLGAEFEIKNNEDGGASVVLSCPLESITQRGS